MATWVYGVTRDGARAPAVRGPPGCGDPRGVSMGEGLALLVSDAPLPAYAAETIDARLQDLDWVSECALAHERVLEAALQAGPVVPLKLFTLFLDDRRAARHLAGDAQRLLGVLQRLEGREEWGVRVRLTAAPAAPTAERPRSGTDFLRGRLARKSEKKERRAVAQELAGRTHAALGARAVQAVTREPAPGSTNPPLLDAAYLVDRAQVAAFQAAAGELAAELSGSGCTLELTGPWPGYSFVEQAA
jgi:hypothetical protein